MRAKKQASFTHTVLVSDTGKSYFAVAKAINGLYAIDLAQTLLANRWTYVRVKSGRSIMWDSRRA